MAEAPSMGRTIAEKILSQNVGRPVQPGEIIQAEYDVAACHDAFTAPTIDRLEEWGGGDLADPSKLVLVPDHYVPSHSEHAKHLYNRMKGFAEDRGIEHFYPLKDTGLLHNVLPEDGLANPGDVVVGTDSHMVTAGAIGAFSTGIGIADLAFGWTEGWVWLRVPETVRIEYHGNPGPWVRGKDIVLHTLGELGVDGAVYQAVEFGGPLVEQLPMDDRFTIANMSVELGAMTGLFEPDDRMRDYVMQRVDDPADCRFVSPDDDADYDDEIDIDCDGLDPQVAAPNSPANVGPIDDVLGIEVDQAVVGSCTNNRPEDLKLAADILTGNTLDEDVRMIVTPGTRDIEKQALAEGWTETFYEAGVHMANPGCGACFGEPIGALDEQEVAITTTNRNFVGRMGAPSSEVYLANPAVAAASAVTGEITHPETVI
jgi:3-isopropylmalate/(R)-2-methylmalate dehydratase large subunit